MTWTTRTLEYIYLLEYIYFSKVVLAPITHERRVQYYLFRYQSFFIFSEFAFMVLSAVCGFSMISFIRLSFWFIPFHSKVAYTSAGFSSPFNSTISLFSFWIASEFDTITFSNTLWVSSTSCTSASLLESHCPAIRDQDQQSQEHTLQVLGF